ASIGVIRESSDVNGLVEQALQASQLSSPDPWFRFPLWRSAAAAIPFPELPPLEPIIDARPAKNLVVDESVERWSSHHRLVRKSEKKSLECRVQGACGEVRLRLADRPSPVLSIVRKAAPTGDYGLDPNFLPVFGDLAQAAALESAPQGPFLLSSMAASELVRLVSQGFVAGSPRFFVDEENACELSPLISLLDDGRHPKGVMIYPFDLEGVPTQRTVLVNRGRWEARLCDTCAGGRYNQLSTGNWFRSPGEVWPRVHPTTFYLEAGESRPQEMFSSLKSGTVLHSIEGLNWQEGGKARLAGMGWTVHGAGQLKPHSRIEIEFKPLNALRCVLAVGSDLEFYGSVGSPSILFKEMP
ncbi:MAG: hypothetical protein HYR96_14455, partial [Deltaproteobacteria bacterium]|nr:hypothetical protein [Deltaproteobacteria bacterium]